MDGPINAEGGDLLSSKRQHDLETHVLLAAERTANHRINDTDFLIGKIERMGDLLAIFVRPLARRLDGDTLFVVDPGGGGFNLKVRMFLVRNLVTALDHNIGGRPARVHVALANLHLVVGVGRCGLFVDEYLIQAGRFQIGDEG